MLYLMVHHTHLSHVAEAGCRETQCIYDVLELIASKQALECSGNAAPGQEHWVIPLSGHHLRGSASAWTIAKYLLSAIRAIREGLHANEAAGLL
jgi:hypothetical protein